MTVVDSESIQSDLQNLQELSETWNLKFNKDNCQTLFLGKNNRKNIYKIVGMIRRTFTFEFPGRQNVQKVVYILGETHH